MDVRYVAGVRPDLVASVTAVGTSHKGAELATYLRAHVSRGSFTEGGLGLLADQLATVLGLLTVATVGEAAADRLQRLDERRAEWRRRLAAFHAERRAIAESEPEPARRKNKTDKLLEDSFRPEERVRV